MIAVESLRSSQRWNASFDTFLGERGKFDAALHGSAHFGPAYCNWFAIDARPSTAARKVYAHCKSRASRHKKRVRRIRPRRSLPNTPARKPARPATRRFTTAGRRARTGSRRTRKAGSRSTAARIVTVAAASHVADPSDTSKLFLFEKASTKEINAQCLTCHAGGTQHMNAINSVHSKNDVSCVSCHSPHHGKDSDFLLVKVAARALLLMPSPTKSASSTCRSIIA